MFYSKSIYYMPKQSQVDYWENEWDIRDLEKQIANGHKKAWWPVLEDILKTEVGPDDLVVEAGCGMGQFVYLMHQMGKKVVGVDVTEKAVERTRKHYPELDLRVQDIRSFDLPDNSVKLMLSLGVLEHFKEGPHDSLKEAARVIQPNGIFFVTIPYNNYFRQLREPWWRVKHAVMQNKAFQSITGSSDIEFYQYTYSEKEMTELLARYGFKVERVLLHHSHVAAAKDFKNAWWFKLLNKQLPTKELSSKAIKKWAARQEQINPARFAHIALYVARKVEH